MTWPHNNEVGLVNWLTEVAMETATVSIVQMEPVGATNGAVESSAEKGNWILLQNAHHE